MGQSSLPQGKKKNVPDLLASDGARCLSLFCGDVVVGASDTERHLVFVSRGGVTGEIKKKNIKQAWRTAMEVEAVWLFLYPILADMRPYRVHRQTQSIGVQGLPLHWSPRRTRMYCISVAVRSTRGAPSSHGKR